MGRIKTRLAKKNTEDLMEKYEEKFSTDFEENKRTVDELTKTQSKKLRNIIAGYATKLKKKTSGSCEWQRIKTILSLSEPSPS